MAVNLLPPRFRLELRAVSLLLFFQFYCFIPAVPTSAMNFIILHNSNANARFEEITQAQGFCSAQDKAHDECIGGFARMANIIKKYRIYGKHPATPGVLYLFAGGLFTGSIWFSIHKSKVAVDMMNALAPDAMSIGCSEFDDDITELANFVDGAKFPVLSANMNVTKEPKLRKIVKSVTLDVKGTKVGVIGHIVQRTAQISSVPDTIQFTEEIEAIEAEANDLKQKGVNIIITLGHSDLKVHEAIASRVQHVDIVIGAKSNTLLSNVEAPGEPETVEGPYPLVITRENGKRVPFVATYGYTKYLGFINVTFDNKGSITDFVGYPIYMSQSIEQDPDVLKILDKYLPDVDKAKDEVLAITKVRLTGGPKGWYLKECNSANLLADALVAYGASKYEGKFWTDTPAIFIHSGMVNIGTDVLKSGGKFTHGHLAEAFPITRRIIIFNLTGEVFKKVLEVSATAPEAAVGSRFLQFSGIQVKYDLSKRAGQRVLDVKIRCGECAVPHFSAIKSDATYKLMTTDFLVRGRMGYDILRENVHFEQTALLTGDSNEVLVNYLRQTKLIYPVQSDRIMVVRSVANDLKETLVTLAACPCFIILFAFEEILYP